MGQGNWLAYWFKSAFIWAALIAVIVFASNSILLGRLSISVLALVTLLAWAPVMATLRVRCDFMLSWRRSVLPLLLCFVGSSILACAALALRGSPSDILPRLGLAVFVGVICAGVGLVPLRWLAPTPQSGRRAP
jgi:hypothetical protein